MEAVVFCGKGQHFDERGSESELRSESVERELEAEVIFSKLDASEFSNWLQPTVAVKCKNNNIISRYITMCA